MKILHKIFFPIKILSSYEKIFFLYIVFFLFFVTLLDIISLSFLSKVIPGGPKITEFDNFILTKIISVLNLNENINLYKLSVIIFILSIILRNFFSFFQQLTVSNFIYAKYAKYSYQLLKTYVLASPEKFFIKNYSYYLKNVIKETQNAFLGVLYAAIYLVVDFFYLISVLAYSLLFVVSDFSKELIIFLSITFSIILLFVFILKKIGKKKSINEEGLYKDAYETLLSFIEIKIIKHTDLFLESFKKRIKKFSSTQVLYGSLNSLLKPTIEIFICTIILYNFFFEKSSDNNITNFLVLFFLLFRFTPILARVSGNLNTISYHYESNKILNEEFKFYLSANKQPDFIIKDNINSIKIKNFFFKYPHSLKYIIKNLSLNFKKGSITGIYGESGSGKSTLLFIICRLLKAVKGDYWVNSIRINDKKDINWNKKISYMSQTSYLIDDSLKYSIFIDKDLAKNKELVNEAKELLKKFKLARLIKYLETDYLTTSLRGTLSVGEKQRIAFIRCILSRPQILILDEPTASLDEKNEKILMNELLKIKDKSIIIMTTHKKNLVKYFDKIVRL
jgi:ABC-type multidrug transport system fused ATPase/permease subunit